MRQNFRFGTHNNGMSLRNTENVFKLYVTLKHYTVLPKSPYIEVDTYIQPDDAGNVFLRNVGHFSNNTRGYNAKKKSYIGVQSNKP